MAAATPTGVDIMRGLSLTRLEADTRAPPDHGDLAPTTSRRSRTSSG
ncbi:hypothetical protein [Nonomuraea dietziae]